LAIADMIACCYIQSMVIALKGVSIPTFIQGNLKWHSRAFTENIYCRSWCGKAQQVLI